MRCRNDQFARAIQEKDNKDFFGVLMPTVIFTQCIILTIDIIILVEFYFSISYAAIKQQGIPSLREEKKKELHNETRSNISLLNLTNNNRDSQRL